MSDTADALPAILNLLADFGVRADDAAAQQAIATRAATGGMTVGDVAVLAEWFTHTERSKGLDSIGAYVASKMGRKAQWTALLKGARQFVDARRTREGTPLVNMPNPHGPGDPDPEDGAREIVPMDRRPAFLRHGGSA